MVWGKIRIGRRMNFRIIQNYIFTAQSYADEIRRSHVDHAAAIGDYVLLMHDNARPDTARLSENMFEMERIHNIEHSTYYPYFNLIEHVCNIHRRCLC